MEEKQINEKRNVIWNMVGATANAFNSFLFTIIVTRINGLDEAGIFTYAFATACLLYIVGIYAGRAFQVTDISSQYTDSDYIYNRVFTCSMMLMTVIAFIGIKGYDFNKAMLLLLLSAFKGLEAFSDVIYGIIQKNHRLYQTGISLTIKSMLSVGIFLMMDIFTKNLILSCISILIVNIAILILYDNKNMKACDRTKSKYNNRKNFSLLKAGLFTFVFTFLGLYLVNASRYAIDDMLANEFQTIFGIIIMPATFMTLLGQYIISPALTKIAKTIKEQSYQELRKMTLLLSGLILGIGLVIVVIAYFLESPVLSLVYGVDLSAYISSMLVIIVGSILYSLVTILSGILISLRKTFGQAIIYGILAIFTTIICRKLVGEWQIEGASMSYFITMFLLAICFISYTIYNLKKCKIKWRNQEEEKNESITN